MGNTLAPNIQVEDQLQVVGTKLGSYKVYVVVKPNALWWIDLQKGK